MFNEVGAIAWLGGATINGQTTASKQTIYTVPVGYSMVPYAVLIHTISASLAGLTDLDLGGDASAGDWLQQISLDSYTATTDFCWIMQPEQAAGPPIVPTKKTRYAAETAFGAYINTGSTGAATFVMDLFGFLY